MPHNQLRIQGGVIVNETPVINQTGIASSNRIRFKPDPQGLSLVEKLGGWARFWATQITNGVVRALHGWQETDNDQWLAFATDNPTGAVLGAVQCSVSAGITTATGTLQNLTPPIFTSNPPVLIVATGGSNQFTLFDNFVA